MPRVRGFTLVELVVILIVLGILAVAVIPSMGALRGWDEIGFRDRLRATLEYARKSAVAQRRHSCVVISGGTVTASIANDVPESGVPTCPLPRALILPGGNTSSFAVPAGVTVTDASLRFSPLGQPSSGATLTVSGAGTITVEAETGYVH